MDIAVLVRNKLDEYGINIYDSYNTEEDDARVFYTDCMIIFANRDDVSINISFQATTKPGKAASMMHILDEIGSDVYIMEDFIFDDENEYVSGEKAYKLIETVKSEKLIEEYHKHKVFEDILIHSDCHEC